MNFFAHRGDFLPAGLFSVAHLILFSTIAVAIIIGLILIRKLKPENNIWVLRIIAIFITLLEIGKITFVWVSYGTTNLNEWVPLYYCSIFIYAIWLAGFGKGKVQTTGMSFLVFGGILAGCSYLCYPNTSLTIYPFFHYITFQSFILHGLMVFSGIFILMKKMYNPKITDFFGYAILTGVISIAALILNSLTGYNLMFISKPLSFQPLPKIYEFSPALYTTITILFQVVIMYFITYGIYKLILLIRNKNKNKKEVKQL